MVDPAAFLAHVGRTYDGGCCLVEAHHVAAYADATQDEHIRYYGSGAIAPPMFHVRPMRDLLFMVMEDPALGLDMLRLVHAEHDARFHRPLCVGDIVHLRGKLTHVEQKTKGVLVEAELSGFVDGRAAVTATTSFYVRGQQLTVPGTGRREVPDAPTPDRAPDHTAVVRVAADQSRRYAEASLDRNPIHLDSAVAQAGGLDDVILHGLCTMALSGRAVLDSVGNSDPLRLKRLGLRWARPVFMGQVLTVRTWIARTSEDGLCEVVFDVLNESNQPVVKRGRAEVSA